MSWAAEEFATVDLGHERLNRRLNKRLVKVVQQWADKPSQCIPTAAGGWGDTAAACRMLDNERCDWREVLEAHSQCTTQRMTALPVVLCLTDLTDTTELDFNGQPITGLGPLSFEAQRGISLHPSYAVSTDREPLGLLDAWMWARKPKDADGQRRDINESLRWIESYERLAERAVALPQTRLMQVGDRESDILGLMQRAQALGWLGAPGVARQAHAARSWQTRRWCCRNDLPGGQRNRCAGWRQAGVLAAADPPRGEHLSPDR